FQPTVREDDRELVAASLASAFGALSALYISSEVGCEGVRWLSTEQFNRWPVLDPNLVTDVDKNLTLTAYREFRKHEATEIPVMNAVLNGAWVKLTAAVAAAAGIMEPERLADHAISFARRTCSRRADRERIALSGRTRGGKSGGTSLARQVEDCFSRSEI